MAYFQEEMAQDLEGRAVAEASQAERTAFFQKVYGLFLSGFVVMGIFGFIGLQLTIQGFISQNLWFGLIIAEAAMTWFMMGYLKNKTSGLILMYLYSAVTGLTFGPLLLIAAQVSLAKGLPAYALVGQAFGLTTCAFLGLTAYVFITRSDFSYLGGFLSMAFFAAMGFVVLSWLGLIQLSSQMMVFVCVGFILLLSLNILYTTSNIIHHYTSEHTVLAATELLISFALLLWYMLRLLIILMAEE